MPNKKISCIIPTFKRNEFLKESINSVLNQSIRPYEILVINNGDEKVELPQELASRVKIFNIIYKAGVAQARNFGASVAQGEYLAFLDDDDLWSKDYLKNIQDSLDEKTACLISRLDQMKDGKIGKYKNADKKLDLDNLLVRNPGITGTNIVIAKEIFFQIGGFDTKLPPSEDKSLVLELLLGKYQIKTLPENQAIIRQYDGERLYNPKNAAEGVFQFMRKYSQLMTVRQKIVNKYKINKYRYDSGDKKILPLFTYYYFLNKIFL